MPNSTEKEIYFNCSLNQDDLSFKLQDVFIMMINVKMLTIVSILTFISMIHINLTKDEHKKVV